MTSSCILHSWWCGVAKIVYIWMFYIPFLHASNAIFQLHLSLSTKLWYLQCVSNGGTTWSGCTKKWIYRTAPIKRHTKCRSDRATVCLNLNYGYTYPKCIRVADWSRSFTGRALSIWRWGYRLIWYLSFGTSHGITENSDGYDGSFTNFFINFIFIEYRLKRGMCVFLFRLIQNRYYTFSIVHLGISSIWRWSWKLKVSKSPRKKSSVILKTGMCS